MNTVQISRAIRNALSLDDVVELVNEGTCEGAEGFEFTSEQLAGQYAAEAAVSDIDETFTTTDLESHLDFLAESGAIFEHTDALDHSTRVITALLNA